MSKRQYVHWKIGNDPDWDVFEPSLPLDIDIEIDRHTVRTGSSGWRMIIDEPDWFVGINNDTILIEWKERSPE